MEKSAGRQTVALRGTPSSVHHLPSTDRTERFAYALAYVVNPLVLPPLLLGLVAAHFGAPAGEVGWTVGVGFVFFALLPLAYVLRLLSRSRIATLEIRERRHRTGPFLVGIASYGTALVVLAVTGSTAVLLIGVLIACSMVNTALLLLINLRWKISVHAAALAGFTSVLLFVAHAAGPQPGAVQAAGLLLRPAPLYSLLPLLLLLMWARVRVGAHTPGQVLAGAVLGTAAPLLELYVLLLAGVPMLDAGL